MRQLIYLFIFCGSNCSMGQEPHCVENALFREEFSARIDNVQSFTEKKKGRLGASVNTNQFDFRTLGCFAQSSDTVVKFCNDAVNTISFNVRLINHGDSLMFDPYYIDNRKDWNPINFRVEGDKSAWLVLDFANNWVDITKSSLDTIVLLQPNIAITHIEIIAYNNREVLSFEVIPLGYEGWSHVNTFYLDYPLGLVAIRNSNGLFAPACD